MSFYQTGEIPDNYECKDCGATGCKLWREYQTFLDHQVLRCVSCAEKNQDKPCTLKETGKKSDILGSHSDQIGWLVPAVPTEENDTYWGYTSVPQPGVEWWKNLPLHPEVKSA